jgi:hypothetical protein
MSVISGNVLTIFTQKVYSVSNKQILRDLSVCSLKVTYEYVAVFFIPYACLPACYNWRAAGSNLIKFNIYKSIKSTSLNSD